MNVRNTISINGKLYARLQQRAREDGLSISGIVESLLVDLTGGCPPRERAPREKLVRPSRSALALAAVDAGECTLADVPARFGITPIAVLMMRSRLRRKAEKLVRVASDDVALVVTRETYDAVEDAATRGGSGAREHGRGGQRDTASVVGRMLDAALVRMLDSYEQIAHRARQCAVCRSRVRPFSPLVAGESVVARCADCARERRGLDGRVERPRAARAA